MQSAQTYCTLHNGRHRLFCGVFVSLCSYHRIEETVSSIPIVLSISSTCSNLKGLSNTSTESSFHRLFVRTKCGSNQDPTARSMSRWSTRSHKSCSKTTSLPWDLFRIKLKIALTLYKKRLIHWRGIEPSRRITCLINPCKLWGESVVVFVC
jgi:hypothetical protein